MKKISMEVNSLDFNVRKIYDSREYMTKMLITAQLVNPNFIRLMTGACANTWSVKSDSVTAELFTAS